MRQVLDAASQAALGGPIPASIKVEIDTRKKLVTMIGPMASGKTRIANAVPAAERKGWRCFTGTSPDQLYREWR